LGAGILTGIGFLGAGTIIRHENVIRGVTTAASLWFVAVLGLAFGSGEFRLGFTGLLVALVVLYLLPILEKRIQTDWYGSVTITLGLDAMREEELRRRLKAHGLKVREMEFSCDLVAQQKTVTCELKMKRKAAFALSTQLLAELRACPGVLHVKWG
jgi:putative Mg2+ transporter-C (MgtC) family protein